jgi:RuvA, C-terminal domain
MPERVTAASSNGHAFEVSLADDAVSALINLGYKPVLELYSPGLLSLPHT